MFLLCANVLFINKLPSGEVDDVTKRLAGVVNGDWQRESS